MTAYQYAECLFTTADAIIRCRHGVPNGYVLEMKSRTIDDNWHEDCDAQRFSHGFLASELEEFLYFYRLVKRQSA